MSADIDPYCLGSPPPVSNTRNQYGTNKQQVGRATYADCIYGYYTPGLVYEYADGTRHPCFTTSSKCNPFNASVGQYSSWATCARMPYASAASSLSHTYSLLQFQNRTD